MTIYTLWFAPPGKPPPSREEFNPTLTTLELWILHATSSLAWPGYDVQAGHLPFISTALSTNLWGGT